MSSNFNHSAGRLEREALMDQQIFEQQPISKVEEISSRSIAGELLLGCTIVNQGGEEIGEIEDVLIDISSGRVTHVLLSAGDWLNSTTEAVAWQKFCFDPTGRCFVLTDEERSAQ
ncbi:MAG: PRC-barrel domain-containing protein [Pseudomonadota bacterium]